MNSQFEAERKKMTSWALTVTFFYVAFLLLLVGTLVLAGRAHELGDLKANEVGDLLAGIGGPFALIWLVYGYFLQGVAIRQQAEELNQNTRALHLQEEALRAQVSEINAAVQQQKEMLGIAKDQLQFQMASFEEERVRERERVTPILKLKVEKKRSGFLVRTADEWGIFQVTLSNIGGHAIDIGVSLSQDLNFQSPSSSVFLKRDTSFQISLAKSVDLDSDQGRTRKKSSVLTVFFSDTSGVKYAQEFALLKDENGAYTGEVSSYLLGSDLSLLNK